MKILILAALIVFGFIAGISAAILVVVWGVVMLAAYRAAQRALVSTAEGLLALAAILALIVAPGLAMATGWRLGFSLALPALSAWRLWALWGDSGHDTVEAAAWTAWLSYRVPTLAGLGVGLVALIVGALVKIPGAGVPLIAACGGLLAVGMKGGGAKRAAIAQLKIDAANATGIGDANSIIVAGVEWHQSGAILAATVVYPDTWVPPRDRSQEAGLIAGYRQHGWRASLDASTRTVSVEALPEPEALPDRIDLPADFPPEGLSMLLGEMIGPDGTRVAAVWDPDSADPHLLVCGPTRSGKSVLLRCLLAQALSGVWRVLIADPKGVDYRWADGLRGLRRAGGDEAYEAIDAALAEMQERQLWMETHAPRTATNLGEVPNNPFPPCLVLIDEAAELVELGDKARQAATRKALGSLARRSRFVQMVMVVATQRPDASIIAGEVRGNLGTRVLTGEGEMQHRMMAFGRSDIEPLPDAFPNGRARLAVGGAGPAECQIPFIDPQAILDFHEGERAGDSVPEAWQEPEAEQEPTSNVVELPPPPPAPIPEAPEIPKPPKRPIPKPPPQRRKAQSPPPPPPKEPAA